MKTFSTAILSMPCEPVKEDASFNIRIFQERYPLCWGYQRINSEMERKKRNGKYQGVCQNLRKKCSFPGGQWKKNGKFPEILGIVKSTGNSKWINSKDIDILNMWGWKNPLFFFLLSNSQRSFDAKKHSFLLASFSFLGFHVF